MNGSSRRNSILFSALLALVSLALAAQIIDLTDTDLGRHLKNGDVLWNAPWADKWAVLQTNYYSYAAANQPVVNHHWLFGLLAFLTWKAAGYEGLVLAHGLLLALAMVLCFWAARAVSRLAVAAPLILAAVPIVVWRKEPRPEVFTFVGIAAFELILLSVASRRASPRWLFLLPLLLLLWVNLHIGFIFGFVLLGYALFDAWRKQAPWFRTLAGVSAACAVAALGNPSGLRGALYPFAILGAVEYPVSELQSLPFLKEHAIWNWHYNWFLAFLGVVVGVCAWRWLQQKPGEESHWPEFGLLAVTAGLGVEMARNMPLSLLFAVPVVAGLIGEKIRAERAWHNYVAMACSAVCLLAAGQQWSERSPTSGIGLKPAQEAPAQFLRDNHITGPFFTNIDFGGYLLWHFAPPGGPFPKPAFVDARPEAYPKGFIKDTYLPMLSDERVWKQTDQRYHFNAILIAMSDGLPAIETFILSRVRDEEWAPVYTDAYTLFFVRNTEQNAEVIAKHRIPREQFR